HLVQHPTRLDLRDPVLDRALALALPDFQRLLGDRLVGEHPDPQLATAPDMTGDRTPRGLDLARRQAAAPERLQTILTEADATAPLGKPAVPAFHLLPELRSFRL